MNLETSAKRLLASLGEIADCFLEEAGTADVVVTRRTRSRIVRYGVLGAATAAASVGVGLAAAYLIRRPSRVVGVTVLQEIV